MESIKELSSAMAKAFPLIEGAVKDSKNPFFNSKYADLASVVAAIKPALSKHGLWFLQAFHDVDNGVCVETVIHHESGEYISCGKVTVPVSKADPQGYGSAMTYARRYSLQAAFGVAPEDDDGNAASKAKPLDAKPNSGAGENISEKDKETLDKIAISIISELAKGNDWGAYETWCDIREDKEKALYVWSKLDSKVRASLKSMDEAEKTKGNNNGI